MLILAQFFFHFHLFLSHKSRPTCQQSICLSLQLTTPTQLYNAEFTAHIVYRIEQPQLPPAAGSHFRRGRVQSGECQGGSPGLGQAALQPLRAGGRAWRELLGVLCAVCCCDGECSDKRGRGRNGKDCVSECQSVRVRTEERMRWREERGVSE